MPATKSNRSLFTVLVPAVNVFHAPFEELQFVVLPCRISLSTTPLYNPETTWRETLLIVFSFEKLNCMQSIEEDIRTT